jgi:hypothetical protein
MSGKSDWKYEQYRLGELSDTERQELEGDPDFSSRMTAFDDSDRDILNLYPASEMARNIAEKSGTAFRPMYYLVPLAAAAVLALAFILVLPRLSAPSLQDDKVETLRPKGADIPDNLSPPEIILYRDGPDGIELLKSGDNAKEHDLLQVGYLSGGNWWGAILSVDGNAVITRHWPMEGNLSAPMGLGGEFLLPYSYELDAAPEFESFVLIWSDAEFSVSEAETLFAEYRDEQELPDIQSLNNDGKSGLTVITVHKTP